MKMSCFVGALALLTATSALAEDTSLSQSPQATQADPAEKKICRTERMTGSLTRSTRTCLTRAQWSALAEATRRSVDSIERDANQAQAIPQRNGPGPG